MREYLAILENSKERKFYKIRRSKVDHRRWVIIRLDDELNECVYVGEFDSLDEAKRELRKRCKLSYQLDPYRLRILKLTKNREKLIT